MVIRKGILAVALSMSVSFVAQAGMTDAQRQNCSTQSEHAEGMMNARQVGVPMREMMNIAADTPTLQLYIKWAFEKPRYTSKEYQQKAVTDFGNEVYQICMTAAEKGL